MVILIWVLCFLAFGLVQSLLQLIGITLGGIPTILLFAGTIFLARTLVKLWKEKHPDDYIDDDDE